MKGCRNPLCCSEKIHCKGLCSACYQYEKKYGFPRDPRQVSRGKNLAQIRNLPAIIARYRNGETCRELAPVAGVSATTLKDRLKKAGVTLRQSAPRRKVTKAEIIQARELYQEGVTPKEIADLQGYNYSTIHQIVTGRTNRTVGGPLPTQEEEDKHPCERCGALTTRQFCRWCRQEKKGR